MHRYSLFHGQNYYPSGGMLDFKKSSDDLEDLLPFVDEIDLCEWAHIYDTEISKVILESRQTDWTENLDFQYEWREPEEDEI